MAIRFDCSRGSLKLVTVSIWYISAHKYFICVNRHTSTEENTTRTIFSAKNIHVYLFIFKISTLLDTPPSCPNKNHKTYSQGWFNAGPAESESTLNQHWVNVTRGYTRRSGKENMCHSICINYILTSEITWATSMCGECNKYTHICQFNPTCLFYICIIRNVGLSS